MTSYRKEKTIMFFAYVISTFLLFKFVPKNKIRHATIAFLFKQVLTWLFGLIVVEKKLIQYPYRQFFKRSYKASFSFEYYLYPVSCVLFNLYFPEKRNILIKFFYSIVHPAVITVFEVLMIKYSKLIRYRKWHWSWSFVTLWFTNYLSHVFYKWFFEKNSEIVDISKNP